MKIQITNEESKQQTNIKTAMPITYTASKKYGIDHEIETSAVPTAFLQSMHFVIRNQYNKSAISPVNQPSNAMN